MSPSINELLEKGLFHYGLGDIDRAIELWKEVLRLDPDNETAREYIEIETGHQTETKPEAPPPEEPKPEVKEKKPKAPPFSQQFFQGQNFLQGARWFNAARSFEAAHKSDPDQPIYWAHVEMARARLVKEVIEALGNGRSLSLKVDISKLTDQKRFTQEDGFVLSLISGDITLDDVVALSPIPNFQTYSIIHRLMTEGLVEAGGMDS